MFKTPPPGFTPFPALSFIVLINLYEKERLNAVAGFSTTFNV
jgi:hypothetical protein